MRLVGRGRVPLGGRWRFRVQSERIYAFKFHQSTVRGHTSSFKEGLYPNNMGLMEFIIKHAIKE